MAQNLTIDQNIATQAYISDQPLKGSMYSMSQNMNYKLNNDMKLNAQEQYTFDEMMSAMHPIGKNIKLTRYDHETYVNGLLQKVGVKSSYDKMNVQQLKTALVGKEFDHKGVLSTSYNDFKKVSGNNPFTSRAVKITYLTKASTMGYMTGHKGGRDFGEIALAPTSKTGGNRTKVLDVKFTGKTARWKGTQSYSAPQIEIIMGIE